MENENQNNITISSGDLTVNSKSVGVINKTYVFGDGGELPVKISGDFSKLNPKYHQAGLLLLNTISGVGDDVIFIEKNIDSKKKKFNLFNPKTW